MGLRATAGQESAWKCFPWLWKVQRAVRKPTYPTVSALFAQFYEFCSPGRSVFKLKNTSSKVRVDAVALPLRCKAIPDVDVATLSQPDNCPQLAGSCGFASLSG
jgi:hypothetical protein